MTGLVIEPSCGPVPDSWKTAAMRQAAGSANRRAMFVGEVATIGTAPNALYLLRKDEETLVLSKDPQSSWVAPGDYSWAPALWGRLMASAPTPEARRDLAWSVLPKLPCGPCKVGWTAALSALTDAHVATDDAFRRWVWSERQDIAERKGRPRWDYPLGAEGVAPV